MPTPPRPTTCNRSLNPARDPLTRSPPMSLPSPVENEISKPAPTSPIDIIISPFTRFARTEAAGGIVLLASTIAALVWSNSPWHDAYHALLETKLTIGFGAFVVTENRHHWINDGLMSLFFFLVGLEIKREFLIGELSSLRRAAFPFIGALGGLIVPAIIYISVAGHAEFSRGW